MRAKPLDWDTVIEKAQELARHLNQEGVDLNEAEKLIDYAVSAWKADPQGAEDRLQKYLDYLSCQPLPRSRRTQPSYQAMARLWKTLPPNVAFDDRLRLWGWAVRIARADRLLSPPESTGHGTS